MTIFSRNWYRLLLIGLLWPFSTLAHELREPEGAVILVVGGNISHTNVGDEAHFDREMLEALPWHSIETSTPWTDGISHYRGPLARALLAALGAQGKRVTVTALNNFMAEIPVSDFHRHPVLLAMEQDGERMAIRDQGPIFVLYPFDQDPSLHNETIRFRSVWQVQRMMVE
ncbi:putative pterin-binding protein [Halomonas sp. 328]|uniref:oxidoreductase n=1 Tax=Halomonas sp. 328 TaxID=2776704 RepID=UPI0018A74466|nr:oxidoreductase [Halomonas sp. 328]MBF8223114.1 oxidoreductase [Halomonas sp. 328]